MTANPAAFRLPRQQSAPAPASRGPSWDFIRIPVFPAQRQEARARSPSAAPSAAAVIQPKLTVGAVDDPLEHEADRVADQVMRMPAPEVARGAGPPRVSRKCAACEEEETLQTKQAGLPEAPGREAPGLVDDVLQSSGQPLDAATRAYFEPRFGHDFSQVRVHVDERAANSATAVGALAYTVGSSSGGGNVVFSRGRYAPESDSGRRLIAHELVHVIQQGRSVPKSSAPSRGDRQAVDASGAGQRGHAAHALTYSLSPTWRASAQVQRQAGGLDPNSIMCALLAAICAGTIVAPELLLPEAACALFIQTCSGGKA
ncbi:MAG: DUF4157 domain-containing protein [Xanthobacteraceae bacterium]